MAADPGMPSGRVIGKTTLDVPKASAGEYRLRFFNFNMANNSKLNSLDGLVGPSGEGTFEDCYTKPFADGEPVDIFFTSLVETRVAMPEYCQKVTKGSKGSDSVLGHGAQFDTLVFQSTLKEGVSKGSDWFSARSWADGMAGYYNGYLKTLLSYNSNKFKGDEGSEFVRKLPELDTRFAGIDVPNPKKAYCGRSLVSKSSDEDLRFCLGAAHFPIHHLADALENGDHAIPTSKLAFARTLRKLLRGAHRAGVLDDRTILFVQGDVNSRTLLYKRDGQQPQVAPSDVRPSANADPPDAVNDWEVVHEAQLTCENAASSGDTSSPSVPNEGDALAESSPSSKADTAVGDVMSEFLRDASLQAAVQYGLDIPVGWWFEPVPSENAADLPVTYKFKEEVGHAFTTDFSDHAPSLTIGDVVEAGGLRADSGQPPAGNPNELYRAKMDSIGPEMLESWGIPYKKDGVFRPFRFPSAADRIIYWAPSSLSPRISWELPFGGYQVAHRQGGSDHRPVYLEALLRVKARDPDVANGSQTARQCVPRDVVNPAVLREICFSDSDGD